MGAGHAGKTNHVTTIRGFEPQDISSILWKVRGLEIEFNCMVSDSTNLGLGRLPWKSAWLLTPVFLPGVSHGQRSLAGYKPWGHKGSDTTERRTAHT